MYRRMKKFLNTYSESVQADIDTNYFIEAYVQICVDKFNKGDWGEISEEELVENIEALRGKTHRVWGHYSHCKFKDIWIVGERVNGKNIAKVMYTEDI